MLVLSSKDKLKWRKEKRTRYVNHVRDIPRSLNRRKERNSTPGDLALIPRDTDDTYVRCRRIVFH
jgi:hypothetical protein